MINLNDIPIIDNSKTLPQINTCAELGCHGCCENMKMTMTYSELQKYHSVGLRLVPITKRSLLNDILLDPNSHKGIYYFTTLNYRSGGFKKILTLQEMVKQNPDKHTTVIIVGECHHLQTDKNGNRSCEIYDTDLKPECCTNFDFGGEECAVIRKRNKNLEQ